MVSGTANSRMFDFGGAKQKVSVQQGLGHGVVAAAGRRRRLVRGAAGNEDLWTA